MKIPSSIIISTCTEIDHVCDMVVNVYFEDFTVSKYDIAHHLSNNPDDFEKFMFGKSKKVIQFWNSLDEKDQYKIIIKYASNSRYKGLK